MWTLQLMLWNLDSCINVTTHQNGVSECAWALVAAVEAVHRAGLALPAFPPGLHGGVAQVVHRGVLLLIRLTVARVETHLVLRSSVSPAVTIYISLSPASAKYFTKGRILASFCRLFGPYVCKILYSNFTRITNLCLLAMWMPSSVTSWICNKWYLFIPWLRCWCCWLCLSWSKWWQKTLLRMRRSSSHRGETGGRSYWSGFVLWWLSMWVNKIVNFIEIKMYKNMKSYNINWGTVDFLSLATISYIIHLSLVGHLK